MSVCLSNCKLILICQTSFHVNLSTKNAYIVANHICIELSYFCRMTTMKTAIFARGTMRIRHSCVTTAAHAQRRPPDDSLHDQAHWSILVTNYNRGIYSFSHHRIRSFRHLTMAIIRCLPTYTMSVWLWHLDITNSTEYYPNSNIFTML